MPPKYFKDSSSYTEPLRMGVSTNSWVAPLLTDMILVLVAFMHMAILNA